jgi:hypothetical protein
MVSGTHAKTHCHDMLFDGPRNKVLIAKAFGPLLEKHKTAYNELESGMHYIVFL